jgi:hypothetical protein
MTKAKRKLDDRFTQEMTETVEGMRSIGVMDEAAYKLTMRDLNRARRNGRTPDRRRYKGDARASENEPSSIRALSPSHS